MHYFRVPHAYWRDRLTKLVELGCNTIETYVAWNAHEPKKGRFDFDGMLNLVEFTNLAGELGLHVIIRPGPYICAEWDLGGLPNWLLAEDLAIRTSDPAYLRHVDDFYDVLIPKLTPLLTTRGGPVIAMQIENEYGYFGNDQTYLVHLRDGLIRRGVDVPLFTSDGTYQRLCVANGGVDGHLRTANFGSGAQERFKVLREFQPDGPLACMEFWVGWFDTWGDDKHHTRAAPETAVELQKVLDTENASVNIYMFHGGTNFGFWAGANLHETFMPFVTSYDYDALLTEWGATTPKYDACRDVLHKFANKPLKTPAVCVAAPRAFGQIALKEFASLDSALPAISQPIRHAVPRSFEKLGSMSDRFDGNGYVLYRTTLSKLYRGEHLQLRDLHDWAHVMLDGKPLATVYRNDPHPTIPLEFESESATLDILAAHLARSNFNYQMSETKGIAGAIVGGPKINDQRNLFGWTHFPISLDVGLSRVPFQPLPAWHRSTTPTLYRTTFDIDTPADTFLDLDGFTLGSVLLNGFNLGRYWSVGPQKALYVPGRCCRRAKTNSSFSKSPAAPRPAFH